MASFIRVTRTSGDTVLVNTAHIALVEKNQQGQAIITLHTARFTVQEQAPDIEYALKFPDVTVIDL